MTDTTTTPLQSQHISNGHVEAKFSLTPAADTKGYHFYIPPDHVIPVIFVPGIMGSNLVNINKRDEKVWPAFSSLSLASKWAFRWADTRQIKLSSDVTDLDQHGPWFGVSKTVHNEAEGIKRGQGTTSKEFYGAFCVWLDNQLNTATGERDEDATPWKRYCYAPGSGETWHAQKPFAPFSLIDARKIWSKYVCPVYVQGYNWTLSNAINGQRLAERIKSIIEECKNLPHKPKCEKVILVSHSMGGLVSRSAIASGDILGNAASLVAGIVHGVQPATGAAAAYHHCIVGYGHGASGQVLGSNGAQVSAVFANGPGAMELLPNSLYEVDGKKPWLKAEINGRSVAGFELPVENPYKEIYNVRDKWYRLMPASYVDPAKLLPDDDQRWAVFLKNLGAAQKFHKTLGKQYHPVTYASYGADPKMGTWNTITWQGKFNFFGEPISDTEIVTADSSGSPSSSVSVKAKKGWGGVTFEIPDASDLPSWEIGDGTVPVCSGEAPLKDGEGNVKQSFRMPGFDHQGSYNNDSVRWCTLYAIGKILSSLE